MELKRSDAALYAVACLWGLAEATLFFIVPDVLLSGIARRNLKTVMKACLASTVGALVGGIFMYAWGAGEPAAALAALDQIPGIGPDMIAWVRGALADMGAFALFLGPLTGTPYKVYAVNAGILGLFPATFALVSMLARALRFVLVSLLAYTLARLLPARVCRKLYLPLWATVWLGFYGFYFLRTGW